MKKHITLQLKYFFICAIILIFQTFAHAQQNIKGEIININYKYQIAFTDIGSAYLTAGDIVEVRMMNGSIISLKVAEATDVLSRLTLNVTSDQDPAANLFDKINVGDTVVKVWKEPVTGHRKGSVVLDEPKYSASIPSAVKLPSNESKMAEVEKQSLSKYDQLKIKYQEVNTQLWELNQHVSYLNIELAKKNARFIQLEKDNKAAKKSLSDSYLNVEKLKRKNQSQVKKINNLKKIIKQLKGKFLAISKLLKKRR